MTDRLMLLDTASLYFRAFFGVPDCVKAPGRHAGQRRARAARLHRPAGRRLPADPPGLLLGQRLAAAVAGRPAPVVQGAPGRGRASRATPGHRGGARPARGAGPDHRRGARGVRHRDRRRRRLRGRRRDRHARHRTPACRSTSSPATATCSSSSTTTPTVRVLYTARGVGKHERVTDDVVREKYGIHAGQYADFATLRGDASDGLPGVAGDRREDRGRAAGTFGDLAGIIAAADDPDVRHGAGPRGKIKAGRRLPRRSRRTVVAVARDIDLRDPDLTLPLSVPVDPGTVRCPRQSVGVWWSAERVDATGEQRRPRSRGGLRRGGARPSDRAAARRRRADVVHRSRQGDRALHVGGAPAGQAARAARLIMGYGATVDYDEVGPAAHRLHLDPADRPVAARRLTRPARRGRRDRACWSVAGDESYIPQGPGGDADRPGGPARPYPGEGRQRVHAYHPIVLSTP